MKVLIFQRREFAVRRTASLIASKIKEAPETTLGLATGGTMEPVYARLSELAADLDCSGLSTFNLDEYVGLENTHPQSYRHYMAKHLFNNLNFDIGRTHLPKGDASDLREEAERYDQLIKASGGIDLQLLGIGANGHIGFNEPFSSLGSRTRVKTLARGTQEANARFFVQDEAVPQMAITMGIQTILEAREIIVLATGTAKAEACRQMIEGAISAHWPASALQLHPKVTVLLDEEAAGSLSLRDYLEAVHPEGGEATLG